MNARLELYPAEPITRLATMVRNRQHLHRARDLAVDDVEMEYLEVDAANFGWLDDARTLRHFASKRQSSLKIRVVTLAQTFLLVLVVGDLLLMFAGRLWMEPIAHLKRA